MSNIDKKFVQDHKNYWWWVADVSKLDDEAVLEGVMNYGKWEDFLKIKGMLGIDRMSELFRYMTKEKKRVNLRPERLALFSNYIARYASH